MYQLKGKWVKRAGDDPNGAVLDPVAYLQVLAGLLLKHATEVDPDLVINLTTATALGLTIQESFLARRRSGRMMGSEREVKNETSPSSISTSGCERCCAAGHITGCEGASLSDARQADLEGKHACLERELAKTKDKLGKMQVDQSIAAYQLTELRKQTETSGRASIEMEFESQSSRFQMKATHPNAAKALKEFATGLINGQADGTLWLPPPVGNA